MIPCSGFRGEDEAKAPETEEFYMATGSWFTRHIIEKPIDNIALMRYLRDTKRICWMEIYLKVFAASEPPLLCSECGQYYTLS